MAATIPLITPPNRYGVLIAASLLAAVLGSVHAFSVFLTPLELQFDQSRGIVSLTYSLTLVTLTLAVLWGHSFYARVRPSLFVLGVCLLAVLGVGIARHASTLWQVWLGYSLLFGVANGLGYGFGLQIAAQANPDRKGVAMGIVTAAYALGAVASPVFFSAAVAAGGFRQAMLGLALILILVGMVCAGLMHISNAVYKGQDTQQAPTPVPRPILVLLWVGYGAGVATGLMVLGHAAGIFRAFGVVAPSWVAPVTVSVCNLAGSLVGGRLADGMSPRRLLGGLALMSALSALTLATLGAAGGVTLALGAIGFAYGGTIAAYPAIIARIYEGADGARIYGRVFTAWGAAGLLAPWLAGALYDFSGRYQLALMVAGFLGVLSCLSVALLFRRADMAQP